MPLTTEQQQIAARHLNTRSRTPKCPLCAASNLRVCPDVIRQTTDTGDVLSSVVVECQYCGHRMHFDPEILGIEPDML